MVTPAAKREAVAHLCRSYEMSERRACAVTAVDRKYAVFSGHGFEGLRGGVGPRQ
jgi:hypothetical protein